MKYNQIQFPSTRVFNNPRGSTPAEGQELLEWLIRNKDERIAVLEKAVKSTLSFEDWKADYKPASLKRLGEWFAGNIKTRPRSEEEIQVEVAKLQEQFKFLGKEIRETEVADSQTISIAYDIGIYFGEILRKKDAGTNWILIPSTKYYDSNQPVLEIENDFFNPRIIERNIKKIKVDNDYLVTLYKAWAGLDH